MYLFSTKSVCLLLKRNKLAFKPTQETSLLYTIPSHSFSKRKGIDLSICFTLYVK